MSSFLGRSLMMAASLSSSGFIGLALFVAEGALSVVVLRVCVLEASLSLSLGFFNAGSSLFALGFFAAGGETEELGLLDFVFSLLVSVFSCLILAFLRIDTERKDASIGWTN